MLKVRHSVALQNLFLEVIKIWHWTSIRILPPRVQFEYQFQPKPCKCHHLRGFSFYLTPSNDSFIRDQDQLLCLCKYRS